MLSILASAKSCCEKIEIIIPSIQTDEMENIINFLYSGTIPADNKIILENLTKVFGFPENMIFTSNIKREIKEEPIENFTEHEENVMDFITSQEFDDKLDEKTTVPCSSVKSFEKTFDTTSRKRQSYSKEEETTELQSNKVAKNFICGFCGSSFSQNVILQLHVKGVHEQLKPFKCNECQESFTLNDSLIHHLKSVHQKK